MATKKQATYPYINHHPENERVLRAPKIVPGNDLYANALNKIPCETSQQQHAPVRHQNGPIQQISSHLQQHSGPIQQDYSGPAQQQHHGPFQNQLECPQIQRASQQNQRVPSQKAKVVLLGDSNFNRIIVPEMNSLLTSTTVTKFSYSGATSLHLRHYSDILLESKPDGVLIHGGTNDIWGKNQRKYASSQRIAEDIISIGLKCKQGGVKTIYISSVLTTRLPTSNKTAGEINVLLKLLCIQHNFVYIDNSFISINDLHQGDEVHLGWGGRKKLVDNYLKILNN